MAFSLQKLAGWALGDQSPRERLITLVGDIGLSFIRRWTVLEYNLLD